MTGRSLPGRSIPYENNNPLLYEHHVVRWLESQGYDVCYVTDVDMHTTPTLPLQHRAVLVAGHDEYWSLEVRNALEQARDAGVSLGFMSANIGYWRVRFESSPSTGVANRVMVCYKDPAIGDLVAPTTCGVVRRTTDPKMLCSESCT